MAGIQSLEPFLDGFLHALQDAGLGPRRAVLFGSYAKGTSNDWSDIDLAVWADGFEGVRVFDNIKVIPLLRHYIGLELHPFHTGETADDNPFIHEIETTGKDVSFLLQPDTQSNHSTRFYNAFL